LRQPARDRDLRRLRHSVMDHLRRDLKRGFARDKNDAAPEYDMRERALALKARFISTANRIESRFQRWPFVHRSQSWGVAPGCNRSAPLALRSRAAPNVALVSHSLGRDLPARVPAFRKFLDHLAIERRDVVGFAAGHETIVDHHFLVHPIASGIFHVGLDRRP
ncbi:MAG: hypothetical protein QOE81_534, partial [Verrucomicrobiota bacterium]